MQVKDLIVPVNFFSVKYAVRLPNQRFSSTSKLIDVNLLYKDEYSLNIL